MTKDKALEDLFLAAKPKFDDKDRFMKSLTRRLDAVEYIKPPCAVIDTLW